MPILLQLKLFNSITFCILTMKYMQFLHFEVKQKKWTDGCVNSIAIKLHHVTHRAECLLFLGHLLTVEL